MQRLVAVNLLLLLCQVLLLMHRRGLGGKRRSHRSQQRPAWIAAVPLVILLSHELTTVT